MTIADPRVVAMGRVLSGEQLLRGSELPVVDLADLASGDVRVRIRKLDLSGGRIRLAAEATIRQFQGPR
jgi:hypothetical protein